jgi:acetyl esterase/lipase
MTLASLATYIVRLQLSLKALASQERIMVHSAPFVLAQFVKLQTIRFVLTSVLLAFGAGAVAGQTSEATGAPTQIKKISRPMVWEPGPEGNQVPLWPEGLAIQRPESSDKPEVVGNGSWLVAGRPWHWASYVTRPTMTIYPPKWRNTGAGILVLPGGGYAAVAMDLEGTEICDWITKQGVTCIVLKYRVPQTWRHGRVEKAPKVQLPLQDAQRAMGLLIPSLFLRHRSPQDRRYRLFCRRAPCRGGEQRREAHVRISRRRRS